jgi:hypothetical protein
MERDPGVNNKHSEIRVIDGIDEHPVYQDVVLVKDQR